MGSSSNLTLAIDVVVRVITVSVRTLRETTCVVRWSGRTLVRPVAPAADASLTSQLIAFSAFFVAFVVAFVVAFFAAVALVAEAAGRDGGHGGRVTVAAVAASAVAAVVVTAPPRCANGLVTVAVAPAAMALAVASRWLVTYLGRSTKRL